MPDSPTPAPKRRPGRPSGGSARTREKILDAARQEFAAGGYEGATMRAIAARASVDPALLHHYFGGKATLFAETIGTPVRIDHELQNLLTGPQHDLGERIVRLQLRIWDDPENQPRLLAVLRAALSDQQGSSAPGDRQGPPALGGYLQRELVEQLTAHLDAPDARLRASLVASQVAGLVLGRYLLRFPELTEATPEELAARIGPNLQRYLHGG